MPYEYREYPEFGWSISRQRLLEQCPRAYYYRYYLSWNGWDREAPEERRLAYRLSKLTGLDAVLGLEMDVRAREIEAACREGRALPSATMLEERTRRTLRSIWRSSGNRAGFEARPKDVPMLRAFYLGDGPSEGEIDRINEKIPNCIRNLLAASHWEVLLACGSDGGIRIPDFAHCFVGEYRVFAAPDLAYVHENCLQVIDWKSGRPGCDDPIQALVSAWALIRQQPSLGDLPARGYLHYLATGEEQGVDLVGGWEEHAVAVAEAGVDLLQQYLEDAESNVPLPLGQFKKRESALCGSCNFVPLCERSDNA